MDTQIVYLWLPCTSVRFRKRSDSVMRYTVLPVSVKINQPMDKTKTNNMSFLLKRLQMKELSRRLDFCQMSDLKTLALMSAEWCQQTVHPTVWETKGQYRDDFKLQHWPIDGSASLLSAALIKNYTIKMLIYFLINTFTPVGAWQLLDDLLLNVISSGSVYCCHYSTRLSEVPLNWNCSHTSHHLCLQHHTLLMHCIADMLRLPWHIMGPFTKTDALSLPFKWDYTIKSHGYIQLKISDVWLNSGC